MYGCYCSNCVLLADPGIYLRLGHFIETWHLFEHGPRITVVY